MPAAYRSNCRAAAARRNSHFKTADGDVARSIAVELEVHKNKPRPVHAAGASTGCCLDLWALVIRAASGCRGTGDAARIGPLALYVHCAPRTPCDRRHTSSDLWWLGKRRARFERSGRQSFRQRPFLAARRVEVARPASHSSSLALLRIAAPRSRRSCRDWVPQLVGLRSRYHRDQDFYSCWISRSSFDFFSRQ